MKTFNQEEMENYLKELQTIGDVETDPEKVAIVHLGHYEKIYAYFKSIGYVQGMNKAMKAKERLLGKNKAKQNITVNRKTSITATQEPRYDISRLTPEQRARFEYLMNKAKGGIV